MPVPASEIVAGEFVALLRTATDPGKLPALGGENFASRVVDWPGVRVKPAETPLVEYVAPETATLDTVTLEFPAFVNVTLCAPLPPIATFPKFRLEVLRVRIDVAAVPVPLSETVLGDVEALVITEILPAKAPGVFGEKATLNVDCLPAATTRGSVIPVMFTPAAGVLACVTVTSDAPPLAIVTDCDALLPTGTFPNFNELGSTDSAAAPEVSGLAPDLDAPVRPMQPETVTTRKSKRAKAENEIDLPAKFALLAHVRERLNG